MNSYNPFEAIISRLDNLQIAVSILTKNTSLPDNTAKSNSEDLIDIHEASRILHMPESTIRYHKSNNQLPYIKPGKRLLFKKQDLFDWLEKFHSSQNNGSSLNQMTIIRKRYSKK